MYEMKRIIEKKRKNKQTNKQKDKPVSLMGTLSSNAYFKDINHNDTYVTIRINIDALTSIKFEEDNKKKERKIHSTTSKLISTIALLLFFFFFVFWKKRKKNEEKIYRTLKNATFRRNARSSNIELENRNIEKKNSILEDIVNIVRNDTTTGCIMKCL